MRCRADVTLTPDHSCLAQQDGSQSGVSDFNLSRNRASSVRNLYVPTSNVELVGQRPSMYVAGDSHGDPGHPYQPQLPAAAQPMSQQEQLDLAQMRAEYLAKEQELEDNIRRMQEMAAATLAANGAYSQPNPPPRDAIAINPGYQSGGNPQQMGADPGATSGYIDVLGADRGSSGMEMSEMATKPFSATAADVPDPDRYVDYEEDTRL